MLMAAPSGDPTGLSGSGAKPRPNETDVPSKGWQPPAFDMRTYPVPSCTSRTTSSSGQGWVTLCSVTRMGLTCEGPPGGAGVMRDGYGEPAPVVPISGRAIGAGFQSADAGCAPASIAIVTSA